MPIEVHVAQLSLDPDTKAPLLLLQEKGGERMLSIYIGLMEAGSIAAAMEEVTPPRPMTHDLMTNLIEDLDARLNRIEIVDIMDGTYFGLLMIAHGGREVAVDCRPSDGVALAVRTGVPILVHESVFDKARPPEEPEEDASKKAEDAWKDILDDMDEDDFGKYKM